MHSLNEKQKLTSIRLKVPDSEDGQVWVQSTISATHKLVRGLKDDFSFSDTDIVLVSNRGGDLATLVLDAVRTAQGAVFIGSNRRAGATLREGDRIAIRLRAGEVLTVRDIQAREKGEGHAVIQPGQTVAV